MLVLHSSYPNVPKMPSSAELCKPGSTAGPHTTYGHDLGMFQHVTILLWWNRQNSPPLGVYCWSFAGVGLFSLSLPSPSPCPCTAGWDWGQAHPTRQFREEYSQSSKRLHWHPVRTPRTSHWRTTEASHVPWVGWGQPDLPLHRAMIIKLHVFVTVALHPWPPSA